MVGEAFPILSTPDLERALGFYEGLLGGDVEYRFPADGAPAYVGLTMGRSRLGLAADPDVTTGPEGQRTALWLYVESCDDALERLRAAGAVVIEEPADQPWGERVARVLDPDGNQVILGQS